ncbi:MAG: fibronectin-binding domain-containing protein [Euryarchaeota archaeon]|nr:fibronectin-binding domain-containing protein [Euryarchaeota archaeon]
MAARRAKDELSAFDLLVLAGELDALSGSYIDRIVQPDAGELVLRLKGPGAGRRDLVIEGGKWVYLREREPARGPAPPAFVMLLRKHLENQRLRSVRQEGFERILVLSFGEGYELVLELFGEGNVVLVKDGRIVQPLKDQSWEHREVRRGREYRLPPARTDPRRLDEADFARLLRASRGDLVRTLAVSFNLGGRYAEEVCERAGLERGTRVGRLGPDEVRALRSAVSGLFVQVAQRRRPTLYLDGHDPVDFAPVELELPPAPVARAFPDLNSLVAQYAACARGRRADEDSASRLSEELERMRRQADAQRKAIEAFRAQAADRRKAGEAVSSSTGQLDGLLGLVDRLRRAGGWKAVSEAFAREELRPAVEARPAEGTVIVRLSGPDGKEAEVPLDVRRSARENASRFFEDAKEAAGKAQRTEAQLEESLRATGRLSLDGLPPEKAPADRAPRRREQWFERYRWFISSDGNIVIGGRDAASNDRVVKRHLGEQDVYAHADVQGAPSVVVKRAAGQAGIPPGTLREACQFALSTSKAWAAGLASGSAFWVRPDQVSKTPPTGEYLARGAFVIRGRKNSLADLELRLALGFIELQGSRVLMCGPESALLASSEKVVAVEPGEEERAGVAARAARELGCGTEEVLRLLPPGKCQLLLLPGR